MIQNIIGGMVDVGIMWVPGKETQDVTREDIPLFVYPNPGRVPEGGLPGSGPASSQVPYQLPDTSNWTFNLPVTPLPAPTQPAGEPAMPVPAAPPEIRERTLPAPAAAAPLNTAPPKASDVALITSSVLESSPEALAARPERQRRADMDVLLRSLDLLDSPLSPDQRVSAQLAIRRIEESLRGR
jgi:hypothetical protein